MAASSLTGDLAERLAAIAAAGFDGVELAADDLSASGMSPAECASRCADHGLVTELFHLPSLALGGSPTVTGLGALALLDRGFATMEELGATSVAIGAPPVLEGDPELGEDSRAQVAALFVAGIAAMAACHGADCVLEARRGTHICDVAQSWQVIEALEDPDLTLTLDVFDLLAGGEPPIDVADLPVSCVGLVRVSDGPAADAGSASPVRFFPGEGELGLVDPVAMLMSLGFDGAISVHGAECGTGAPAARVVAQHGADALQALLGQAESVAEYAPPMVRYMR